MTVDPKISPSGNPFKCHEEVLYLQPLIPSKRFDIFFPPDWGMLRRSRRVQFFYKKYHNVFMYFVLLMISYHCFYGTTLYCTKH